MTEVKIIVGKPPNFDDIVKVFPAALKATTIFAYWPSIYVSSSTVLLTEALKDHEGTHLRRQRLLGVEEWWRRYLDDVDFRYMEELLAHRAEYKTMVKNAVNRDQRRGAIKIVAKRLCAPMYHFNISPAKAIRDIEDA